MQARVSHAMAGREIRGAKSRGSQSKIQMYLLRTSWQVDNCTFLLLDNIYMYVIKVSVVVFDLKSYDITKTVMSDGLS